MHMVNGKESPSRNHGDMSSISDAKLRPGGHFKLPWKKIMLGAEAGGSHKSIACTESDKESAYSAATREVDCWQNAKTKQS